MGKQDLKGDASSWLEGEGTLCWAKITGHPVWPGQVIREGFAPVNVRKLKKPGTVLLAFFGDLSFGWYPESQLFPFSDKYESCSKGAEIKKNKAYRKAVEEAKEVDDRRKGLEPKTHHHPLDMLQPETWRTEFGVMKVPKPASADQLQDCSAQYALEWMQELGTDPMHVELIELDANQAAAALCWDFMCSHRTYITQQEEEAIASRPIPDIPDTVPAVSPVNGRDDKVAEAGSGPSSKAKHKQELIAALKGNALEKAGIGKSGKGQSPVSKSAGKTAAKESGKKRGRKQQEDEEGVAGSDEEKKEGGKGSVKAKGKGPKQRKGMAKETPEEQEKADAPQGPVSGQEAHDKEETQKQHEQSDQELEVEEQAKSEKKKAGKTPASAKSSKKTKKGKGVSDKKGQAKEEDKVEDSKAAAGAEEGGSEMEEERTEKPSAAKKAGSKDGVELTAAAVTVRVDGGRVVRRAPPKDPLSLLAWCDPIPDETYMEDQQPLRTESAVLRIPSELETRYWGSCGARAAAEKVEDVAARNKLLYGGSIQVELEELLAWVRELAQDPTPESGLPGSRQVRELMTSPHVVAALRLKEATQRHSSLHRVNEVGSLLRGSMEVLGSDFITPRTQWPVPPPSTAPSSLLTTRMVYPDAQVCGSSQGAQAIRKRVHASLLAMHAKGKPKVIQPAEKTPATAAGARTHKQKSFSYAEDSASEDAADEKLFVASEEEEGSEDLTDELESEGEGAGKKRRRPSAGLLSPQRGKGLSKPVFHKKKLLAYKAKAAGLSAALDEDEEVEEEDREVEQVEVLRKEYMERLPPNEAAFQASFQRWQAERGKDWGSMPQMADGYPWKPYDLLQLVAEQGGCEAVTQANGWAQIAGAYQQRIDDQRAAAGQGALSHSHTTALRKQVEHQYKSLLQPFENHLSKDCHINRQLVDKTDEKGNLVYKRTAADDDDTKLATRTSYKPVKKARTTTGYDLGDFDDLGGSTAAAKAAGGSGMAAGFKSGTAAATVAQKPAAGKQPNTPGAARTGSLPRAGSGEAPSKLNKHGSGRLFDAARPSAVGGGHRAADMDHDMRRVMIRYPERTTMPTHQRVVFVLKKFVPSLKKEGVTVNANKCVITVDAESPAEAQKARQELQLRPWNHFPEMRLERHHTIIVSIVKADDKPPPRPSAPPGLAPHPSMNGTRNGRPQGLHMQPPPPPPGMGGMGGPPGPPGPPMPEASGAALPAEGIGPALAALAAPLDPRRAAAHVAAATQAAEAAAAAHRPGPGSVFSLSPAPNPPNKLPAGVAQQSLGLAGMHVPPLPADPRRQQQPLAPPPAPNMWQPSVPAELMFTQQLQPPAPAAPQPAADQLNMLSSLISSITQQSSLGGIAGMLGQPQPAAPPSQELGPDPATLQQLLELLNAAGAAAL